MKLDRLLTRKMFGHFIFLVANLTRLSSKINLMKENAIILFFYNYLSNCIIIFTK